MYTMSEIVSFRLPEHTVARLRQTARKSGRSLNEVGSRSIEEWLRQTEFAEIEFRSFSGERHACIKGALPVWQLVMVGKSYAMDVSKTASYFGWPKHKVQAGFNYYQAYRGEIDEALADHRSMTAAKLQRLLPSLEVFTVPAARRRRKR